MIKYFLILLAIVAVFSCRKDGTGDTYIVSANKMIGLTGNNWSSAESQLRNNRDYKYTAAPANLSTVYKASVHLQAVDDSNSAVTGTILLNVVPDNTISYAAFSTDPVTQTVAYAMMLNYHRLSLQTLTAISFSIGEVVENNMGGNTTVDVVLSKLSSGQPASQLGITYHSGQGRFTMVIFRQNDGNFIFSYRGSR